MECKIKLKLTQKQFEVFIEDWRTNYPAMTFQEYFDNLIKECGIDTANNN